MTLMDLAARQLDKHDFVSGLVELEQGSIPFVLLYNEDKATKRLSNLATKRMPRPGKGESGVEHIPVGQWAAPTLGRQCNGPGCADIPG